MTAFRKPGDFRDARGRERVAGFELEVGNLAVRETARALADRLGGTVREDNPFRAKVEGTAIGSVTVERDAEVLSTAKYREALHKWNIVFDADTLAAEIERGVDRLAAVLIPCEVVTEPLRFEDFPRVNEIVAVLNALEASGTGESIFYAFGLHLNPSAPDLEPSTLTAFTQAFLLVSDWIIDTAGVDISRRYFTSFINPYPDAFVERLLEPGYGDDPERFMDDYLTHNPTRNRALDMLPLLAEIDEARVREAVREEERSLVSARPAFHYRLADCRPGDPEWSVGAEWNRWWVVERLAADDAMREALADEWRALRDETTLRRTARWVKTVATFLTAHLDEMDGRS